MVSWDVYFPRAQGWPASPDPNFAIFRSEPDQMDLKSRRNTYHIALDDFTLGFCGHHFSFFRIWWGFFDVRKTTILPSPYGWRGFFFDKNATVTDPDHLLGHSKVILGNMIRVWTISELYLGCIGREQVVLVQKLPKMCEKWDSQNRGIFEFLPLMVLPKSRYSRPNQVKQSSKMKQTWYLLP